MVNNNFSDGPQNSKGIFSPLHFVLGTIADFTYHNESVRFGQIDCKWTTKNWLIYRVVQYFFLFAISIRRLHCFFDWALSFGVSMSKRNIKAIIDSSFVV